MRTARLDLNRTLHSLPLLLLPSLRLDTHDTSTPMSATLLVLAGVALVNSADQLGQFGFILALHLRESQNSGRLLVHDGPETGLALDDGVGDAHLSAECGEEDDQFDGVDVVGDQNERGFLGFDQADNVVEAVFDSVGFLYTLSALSSTLMGRH